MKKSKLPKTDSIRELAEFWDTHDLTDFKDELEEVIDPILERISVVVPLNANEALALRRLAKAMRISEAEMARQLLVQRLSLPNGDSSIKRKNMGRRKQVARSKGTSRQ